MEDYQKYLDPKVLNKISGLELKARLIVEGFISGLHKSPYHGFSVEFAQHREYVPGDDLRYLDWKVYGKSDRFYIKEYEEETNLISYLFLDASASMQYKSGVMSKYEYACCAISSLAYLVIQQQDAVGFALFNDKVRQTLPPSSNPSCLREMIHHMGSHEPTEKTDLGTTLLDLSERIRKKGLVVIASDFFDDMENILAGLRRFRYRKHDVILLHILDRDEIDFPIQRMTSFEGLENIDLKVLADPRSLRSAYLEEFQKFVRELKQGCLANRIDYVQIATDQNLDVALSTYLSTRASRMR